VGIGIEGIQKTIQSSISIGENTTPAGSKKTCEKNNEYLCRGDGPPFDLGIGRGRGETIDWWLVMWCTHTAH